MLTDKIEIGNGEEMIIRVRRHWFYLAAQLSVPLILALLPLAIPFLPGFLTTLPIDLPNLAAYAPVFVFFYAAWLLFFWMLAFNIWTQHYLDILVLTNERVIVIDQKGLFFRNVASFRLERLQDIYVEVNGLIATFFDYGTVHAETAGHGDEEFRALYVPRPRDLKALILNAADKLIREYDHRPPRARGGM